MTDRAEIEALAGRFDKFRTEWAKRLFTGDDIHSLHMGTAREAAIRASDLAQASTALLSLLAENERLREELEEASIELQIHRKVQAITNLTPEQREVF